MDLAYIPYWKAFPPSSGELDAYLESCSDTLKEELPEACLDTASTGLYLASSDAGLRPSVDFWAMALDQGPGLVFPQTFPQTLANYPAGYLARALAIRGPNYTLVGRGEALLAALTHAWDDVQSQVVSHALLLGFDAGSDGAPGVHLVAMILGRASALHALTPGNAGSPIGIDLQETPSNYLLRICGHLARGAYGSFGTAGAGPFSLRPASGQA